MNHPNYRRLQQGLSLIELMIGMTIGLVLIAGLVVLFSSSSYSTNELEKSIRQFENGRYAVDLLNEDINHAGFYGDVLASIPSPPGYDYVLPNPCATAIANLGWLPPITTMPQSAANVPTPINGLTSAEVDALACLPNHKANTPAIALRRLDTAAVAPAVAVSGSAYVQSSRCGASSATFMISTATGTTATFPLMNVDCSTASPTIANLRRHVSRVYYIASCNECGVDTTPTLKRADLVGDQIIVEPMVEGIDDIAFEFGFDTNTAGDTTKFDGNPDEYRIELSGTAGANNNDWKNVVSVRIHILSRNTESTPGFTENKTYSMGLAGMRGPFTDGFKRRSYSITSNLSNVSGIRDGS